MTEDNPDLIEDSPIFADDPNRQPGGAYWYKDRPDYDKTRANVLEFLAVMLWEEMMYLRDGTEPEGATVPRAGRLQNISTKTSEYLTYTMKDLRPQGLWDSRSYYDSAASSVLRISIRPRPDREMPNTRVLASSGTQAVTGQLP